MSGSLTPAGQIDTYGKLVDSIANWLARPTDTKLRERIPEFITLAEADMAMAAPLRAMETRAEAQINAQFEWLPADVVEISHVFLRGRNKELRVPLRYLDTAEIAKLYGQRTGDPEAWNATGDSIQFAPFPVVTTDLTAPWFEVVYYAKPRPLGPDGDAQFNNVLKMHPDVYLYGALLKSAPYLIADNRVEMWSSMYERALGAASARTTAGNRGAVRLRARNPFRTNRRR